MHLRATKSKNVVPPRIPDHFSTDFIVFPERVRSSSRRRSRHSETPAVSCNQQSVANRVHLGVERYHGPLPVARYSRSFKTGWPEKLLREPGWNHRPRRRPSPTAVDLRTVVAPRLTRRWPLFTSFRITAAAYQQKSPIRSGFCGRNAINSDRSCPSTRRTRQQDVETPSRIGYQAIRVRRPSEKALHPPVRRMRRRLIHASLPSSAWPKPRRTAGTPRQLLIHARDLVPVDIRQRRHNRRAVINQNPRQRSGRGPALRHHDPRNQPLESKLPNCETHSHRPNIR